MTTILILYVPVIHRGYLDLIKRYRWVAHLYLLGQNFVEELAEHIEIRALEPTEAGSLLQGFFKDLPIGVLDQNRLSYIHHEQPQPKVVTANEALTRKFMEHYLPDSQVVFENTFLRWEEKNVFSRSDVAYDRVSTSPEDRDYMRQAEVEAEQSADWWRRVGAVLKVNGKVFKSHNVHLTTDYTPYIDGDPRDSIDSGTNSNFSSALHSEKGVFAQALQEGVSTRGASLYTTVFPCPDCAMLITFSGVKKLFYRSGHASLDGVAWLKSRGVEIVKVE